MGETAALILEILVIIATIIFLVAIVINHIYRKVKGLPTGDCACCHKSTKKLLKEYHKCCCSDKK